MSVTLATEERFGSGARHMGKILDQLNKGYYTFATTETWTPNVNLYETATSYQVCVDLAGVDKEKIDLEVHGQRLTIKGTRAVPTNLEPDRRARVHLMEIDHGGFARIVELPHDVVSTRISAEHRNGLLWIDLPKA